MSALKVGDKLPDATLPDQDGTPRTLSQLWQEGPMVLYFYPKDETAGCTVEACTFRDEYQDFTDVGARVVGVSRDGVQSHKAFATHHRLPFTLLADPSGSLHDRCGVEARMFGMLRDRVTYVIDRTGTVRHVFTSKLDWKGHVRKALEVVKQLRA